MIARGEFIPATSAISTDTSGRSSGTPVAHPTQPEATVTLQLPDLFSCRLFDLLNSRVVRRGPKRGDRDGDGQAAVIARTGGGGAPVDCGDGRDDGQTETEALVGGALVEPLERLEYAVGLRRADERAGVRDAQLTASCDGAGADPDVTRGSVVADCVVD